MLTVLLRSIDIDSDSGKIGLNLQGLVLMGMDHNLCPLLQWGAEKFRKQPAREDNRMAPSSSVARDNDELFCLVETVDHVIDQRRAYEWMIYEMNQYPVHCFSAGFRRETPDRDD